MKLHVVFHMLAHYYLCFRIDDICNIFYCFDSMLFADDTTINCAHRDTDILHRQVNIELTKLCNLIWEEFCICNTRYTSPKTQTRFKKTYLFMIYERFRRYSHLPHLVANNGINCYDTKLSKYQIFMEHNYVSIDITIDNRYI